MNEFTNRAGGQLILPEVRLAIALRFLAGGQVLDLKCIYHVGKTECYRSIYMVVDSLNENITIEFPIDDLNKLEVLEAEFASRSRRQVWRGQVGAVDGCHFGQKNPGKAEHNPNKYYVARKAMHALLAIATCDAHRRFLDIDISQTPTTHDSTAFSHSDLGMRILSGDLPYPFFLNGDNAFVCSCSMMTPVNTVEFTDFDFEQSSNRMPIECAFGNAHHK